MTSLNDLLPHLYTALMFLIPVIIGGVLHMIVVSKDMFNSIKVPISKLLFGENKTYRGLVIMPVVTAIGTFPAWALLRESPMTIDLSIMPPAIFGFVIGLAYIVSELPNSFLKRRMGIKPGASSEKNKAAFIIMDQVDSNIGICLAAFFIFKAPLLTMFFMFTTGLLAAFLIKRLLYLLKLKKTAL